MNRKQWLAFAVIFFLISLYFFSWYLTTNSTILDVKTTQDGAVWIVNRICGSLYLITFGIFIGCLICGWLEKKKRNMEDDAPKHQKDIVKLARLEHEVKELKGKLKREGNIKS